jgi:hypothetical protein
MFASSCYIAKHTGHNFYEIRIRGSATDQRSIAYHEIGHLFLDHYLGSHIPVTRIKRLFGDVSGPYPNASLAMLTRSMAPTQLGFVSLYAQSCPEEDWAEAFGHTLEAIVDGEALDCEADALLCAKIEFILQCITSVNKRFASNCEIYL